MSEHTEQVALFQWAESQVAHTPLLSLLHAIPNSGAGAQGGRAGWLKAEGVKSGVPDIFLPVPQFFSSTILRPGYYIELKVGMNKPSEQQEWWIYNLRQLQYQVDVFWDWQLAAMALAKYVKMPLAFQPDWMWSRAQDKAKARASKWEMEFAARMEAKDGERITLNLGLF